MVGFVKVRKTWPLDSWDNHHVREVLASQLVWLSPLCLWWTGSVCKGQAGLVFAFANGSLIYDEGTLVCTYCWKLILSHLFHVPLSLNPKELRKLWEIDFWVFGVTWRYYRGHFLIFMFVICRFISSLIL